MKRIVFLLFFGICMVHLVKAQVKIGENPQSLDGASVLELESTDKVLVITRVSTAEMNAITPLQGALVYNTDVQSVHYYDGTQWVNIGGGGSTDGPLTADPIVNDISTIVITPTGTGNNLEVAENSIGTTQIRDFSINGTEDILDGSIGTGKFGEDVITQFELSENSVGPIELDNANIGVSAFTNDVGYITSANVVSLDGGNALQVGTDDGAYYDETPLINAIQDNTDAINLDNDANPNNEIQNLQLNGNDLTISGSNTVTLPSTTGEIDDNELITDAVLNGTDLVITEAGTDFTVPLASLSGGGGNPNDELTDISFNTTTNILSLSNPATVAGGTVDLSSLAGGGGNQNLGQVLTTGNDGGASLIRNIANPVDPQDAATRAYVDAAVTGGGSLNDGTILIGDATNAAQQLSISGDATLSNTGELTIAPNAIEPSMIQPAAALSPAADQVLITTDAGAVEWQPFSTGGGEANVATNVGTGGVGITLAKNGVSLPFKSINSGSTPAIITVTDDATNNEIDLDIANSSLSLEKIAPNGATTDGQIIQWNTDINGDGSGGGWDLGAPTTITGTADHIFFADATTGEPVVSANGGLLWDPTSRFDTGALFVGLDGFTQSKSTEAKVQILENLNGQLAYPLQIQNRAVETAVNPSAVGMLFAVERAGDHGKGSLVFERMTATGSGDFHFLQDTDNDNDNPALDTDKAFTITEDKDIRLYRGIDIDGVGFGASGQVLASGGPGNQLQWVNGGSSTDDQNIQGSVLTGELLTIGIEGGMAQDVDLAPFALETEMATAIMASADLDLDKDNNNEIQTITSPDGSVTVTSVGTNDYELTVANGSTDDQNIQGSVLTGELLTIGIEGGMAQDVDLAPFALETEMAAAITASANLDLDKDETNEIQSVAATDATIVVTPAGTNDFTIAVGTISGGLSGNIAANSISQGDIGNNAVGAGEIDSGAVSSDEISDGSVVDIDISATAAIAGSKIAPDFGGQNITGVTDITVSGSIFRGLTDLHPDYVFQHYFSGNSELKSDYEFKSLQAIEAFVKRYNHLPGIKSAQQVKDEGVWNISESNIQNLEKIEELFLHTIEQEHKIKALQSENQNLSEELNALKRDLEEIKALLKNN